MNEDFPGSQSRREQTDDVVMILAGMRAQAIAQHDEHVMLIKKLTAIAEQQLIIAQEYKSVLGDPLQKGRNALLVLRTMFAWVAGTLLTFWGLREIFDSFFVSKFKP